MRYRPTLLPACVVLVVAALGGSVTQAAAQTIFRPTLSPWEGFYLGVHGGYGWGNNDVLEDPANPVPYNGAGNAWSYDADGFLAGVHAGLNWESYRLLLGVEASVGYMAVEGDGPDPASPGMDTVAMQGSGMYGDVTGRIGFAPDKFLYYIKGGTAFADLDWSVDDVCAAGPCSAAMINAGSNGIEWGWTAGAGIAWAASQNVSLRLEYAYYDFGGIDVTGISGGSTYNWRQDVTLHTVTAGLSFMF